MKTKTLLIIGFAAVFMTGCIRFNNMENIDNQEEKELTVRDFFRNSEKMAYQISPDGKYLSYMAPYESRMNVFIEPVDGGEAVRITSETDRNVGGYAWANSERIVYLKDTGGDENYQLYGVKKDGSDFRTYTAIPNVLTQIADILKDNDDEMLITTNERNPQIFDLYRLNVNTGERVLVCENPGNIQGWQTDHEGKVRIAFALEDGVNTTILYRENEGEEFHKVLTTNYKDEIEIAEFTPDNKNVYAITNIGHDKSALVLMDPRTCKELEVLYENPKYDVSGIAYSDEKEKLLAVSCQGYKGVIRHFFDEEFENTFSKIEGMLTSEECSFSITDWDKSEKTMIVRTYSDKEPGRYYLYKEYFAPEAEYRAGGGEGLKYGKIIEGMHYELKKIADSRPWIKPYRMCSMIPVEYTSRDGLNIEAYLTLPKGMRIDSAKNLPVVVNPHGGPWVRDVWGFNPEVQFLAHEGYAVLQMNFRGSTGYGRNFKELSFKQWGQNMQNDITDGVSWLINKGIADPKRIAIYGGSYGGYATLCGITKTPDLYACAIDYVGVSNLFTFMNTIPPYWKPLIEMMYDMVGDPVADSIMLRENSPVFLVDKIKTPLFVAQGANDPRVNKNESDQMVKALRDRGIDVDYMVKDNEGHGFHNEENRFEFYEAMEAFLEKYLK